MARITDSKTVLFAQVFRGLAIGTACGLAMGPDYGAIAAVCIVCVIEILEAE